MRWITSEGGPLLLLDEEGLEMWGGVLGLLTGPPAQNSWSPGGTPTDYDRACSIEGYIGSIAIGAKRGIVFGDEPMRTAWVPCEEASGGTVVRWVFGESEDEFLGWVDRVPEASFRSDGLFEVLRPKLLMFDSAVAGRNVKKRPSEYLSIELEPRSYAIETAVYQPDARTSMIVHRFVPAESEQTTTSTMPSGK